MVSKRMCRLFFAGLVILSGVAVVNSYASTPGSSADFRGKSQSEIRAETGQMVPPRQNITVIATDSNSWLGREASGPRARAELVAFNPNGSILYYNDSHTRYWDVDPVKGTTATVEYSYADHLKKAECPTDWNLSRRNVDEKTWNEYMKVHGEVGACTRNGIERVNLTTGEVTDVWSEATPGKEATRYHDMDRLNKTHFVVADIFLDRVFIVDTRDGQVEWTWNASDAFSTSDTGGPYPDDWTHINNVEVLDDGRIAVSARNNDRVLFLKRGQGLVKNWTLGEEDNYDILYEQHNPDFIEEDEGGPAELVADSENNRVVEYQRENGTWERTWTWQDSKTQWPRDADRLPNGHTLITDSNGNRVFEVNEKGKIVWDVQIAFPYEAERLGTGDESAGGPSAKKAGLESRSNGVVNKFWIGVKDAIPGKYLNGLMYITPVWIGVPELFAVLIGVLSLVTWGLFELKWRGVFTSVRQRIESLNETR
ncbi:arylsulfotransferase family protein [Haladaptatus sp. DYF46]|uniref:arylsulfotransferase family protein n=1 Tax=Haladaptatus sp. DYF46 TaxID=2886041 RepID=UPI001E4A90EB|nr:arylsulfotransferase family protein [Haladaptatus sp. DYF46]